MSAPAQNQQHFRPLLVVMGGTGAQGASVVQYVSQQGRWRVRVVTRDPSGEKAVQLAQRFPAIELVRGDADNAHELRDAFKGAEALFAMTDFYTPTNLTRLKEGRLGEVEQGKRIADAAKAAGVKYVLWSALHNSEALDGNSAEELEGTRPPQAIMFTAKNIAQQYAQSIGLQTIGVWAGWFLQNLPTGLMPAMSVGVDGVLEWTLPLRPDVGLPVIDIEQFGHYVVRILNSPQAWVGKSVLCASEYISLPQMARIYGEVSGVRTRYRPLSYTEYRTQQSDTPWVEAYVEMFRYFNLRGYFAGESLEETEERFGRTATFQQWLERTGWRADVDKIAREGQAKHAAATAARGASGDEAHTKVAQQEDIKRIVRSSVRDLIRNSPDLKELPVSCMLPSGRSS